MLTFTVGKSHLYCNFVADLCLVYLHATMSLEATDGSAASRDDDGATGKRDTERIHNGKVPPEGKYPSLARISHYMDDGSLEHYCHGSILNRDWILTGASCFVRHTNKRRNISRIRITVGDSIRNETEPYEQTLRVERVIIHEKVTIHKLFKSTQFFYDIAVAKVVPSIRFSNRVTAVNLPTCGEFELGTGWMAAWSYGDVRLKEIYNPLVTNEVCEKWLKTLRPHYEITKLVFCARYIDRMGWCVGDYGAPLFFIKNESYMVQIGIASVRPKYDACARDGHMAMYTRVSEYLGWIHRRISNCGNHPFHPVTEVDDENY